MAHLTRAVRAHLARTLRLGSLALGVGSATLILGNLSLWGLGAGLRGGALSAPLIFLPCSAVGWWIARRPTFSPALLRAWWLARATVPGLALLINRLWNPDEAAVAAHITIWLYPFAIAATVMTLDRGLSHQTAMWCAVQTAGVHILAASAASHASPGLNPMDGMVRVAALLLLGFFSGHANNLAFTTLRQLVREEEQGREARLAAIRAEAHERTVRAFLAMMRHELKTPLHVILGNLDLLLAAGAPPDTAGRLEAARQSGRHLLSLVGNLLDQSQMSTAEFALAPERVELETLLAQLGAMLQARAEARGLRLFIRRAERAPSVLVADPLRLRQVLLNLMDNAIKFTDAGEVRLIASAGEGAEEVRFEVIDTGTGIPPDALARVVEPFYQVAGGARGGVGLGLSIARELVGAMGGRLELWSLVGQGSRVRVTLPGAEQVAGAPEPAAMEPRPLPLPAPLRAALQPWVERGNMAEVRRLAREAALADPSLRPACEALQQAAEAFDDRALERLMDERTGR